MIYAYLKQTDLYVNKSDKYLISNFQINFPRNRLLFKVNTSVESSNKHQEIKPRETRLIFHACLDVQKSMTIIELCDRLVM